MNEQTDTVTEVSFFKVIGQFLKMASPFVDILLNSPHKEEWLNQISKSSEFHKSFHLIFPKIIPEIPKIIFRFRYCVEENSH